MSITADETALHISQNVSPHSEVSVAYSSYPCVRNSFRIISADKVDRTNELLKYGQDFCLKSLDDGNGQMLLYSSPKTAGLAVTTRTHMTLYHTCCGEVNQNVGFCLKVDPFCSSFGCIAEVPISHCRWRVLHLHRGYREETQCDPIPVFIIILY